MSRPHRRDVPEAVDASEILIVAATVAELCGRPGLVCGVGPVEAAAATARELAARPPGILLHVGIAGATPRSGLVAPQLVLGEAARYEDLDASAGLAPALERPPADLLDVARRVLPDAIVAEIGTSARVGGASTCPVEAMEGFAVLRAATVAGVPALELRAISNAVGARRGEWRVDQALAALDGAVGRLLVALT